MKQVYLDSRDLIRLVSKDEPICPSDLATLMASRQWQLVYSFANICEVVVLNELLETKRRLQVLDQLPHSYIFAPPIMRCIEFSTAVKAFQVGVDPQPINPFTNRWHHSYSYPGQPDLQNLLVNYTLADQVLQLAIYNADVCRNLRSHASMLQHSVNEDRETTDDVRRNRDRFEGAVMHALLNCGIALPATGRKRLARWIRADPHRCPGWRMFNETYLEFCTNTQDRVDNGDISDFSHIMCIPYVAAITLDRRMAGYAKASALKLSKGKPAVAYMDRIFQNTEMWLRSM